MPVAVSTAVGTIRDIEILNERHRLLRSIVGLVTIQEIIVSIRYSNWDIDCLYQITATCDWDSGDTLEVSVVPVPSPPPRHSRRGFWWAWTN